MRRFLALVLAFGFCLLPVSAGAQTYAEYLADQVYSQDEIDEIISSGEDVNSGSGSSGAADTIYIDNTQLLDSGSVVQVDSLTVSANQVLMSVPEDNVYPPSAPLAGGVYMQVDTQQLGELIIYVPVSYQFKSFTFAANTETPVNITSSTISGYTYSSTDYQIRWASFGQCQYRPYSGSYSYTDLDITSVLNTNIVFVTGPEDLPVVPDSSMLQVIIVFLLGVMVLCLFMRRL